MNTPVMSSLTSFLPKPKHASIKTTSFKQSAKTSTLTTTGPPPYGQRGGHVPRESQDFGDGGSFPEIHIAQYPLGMGLKRQSKANVMPLQVDGNGQIQYDALVKYGHDKDRLVQSKFSDLVPMTVNETDDLSRPGEEVIQETTEKTRDAIAKIVNEKIAASQPKHVKKQKEEAPSYILYTPQEQSNNPNAPEQRVIRMVDVVEDPMEPPRFRYRRMPRAPPSPPAPVLHSPPRKVSVQEQNAWKIPPCISNWKNPRGYTIPLDKRLASDGRGLQEFVINDNFAKMSEALYLADRHAREEIEKRAALEKKLAENEKKQKAENLRKLAQRAREERVGTSIVEQEDQQGYRERESIRKERSRPGVRDVSEKVVLSAAPPANRESMFDQRLFNQSQGLSSGLNDDEAYNLYDKPLFKGSNANMIYRPKRHYDEDMVGQADQVESLLSSRGAKVFKGADEAVIEDGPVQFEKDESDPFGLDEFLAEAKKGH